MKKVQVLMSAYNGHKYIAQQIESILGQKNVEVALLIRDDGSIDDTPLLLADIAGRFPCVEWWRGSNLGTAGSFYELLRRADPAMDYYAFADQDDIWLPYKLFHAVEFLEYEKSGQPLLYASSVYYTSADLRHREKSPYSVRKPPGFGNALVENICMGCTQVFNGQLLQIAREGKPAVGILHDWWLYLAAACFGKVIYDSNAYILYRQHDGNQIGMQPDWFGRWIARTRRLHSLSGRIYRQACDFQKAFALDISQYPELGLIIESRRSWMDRVRLAFAAKIYRQGKADNIIYHILFAAGFL